MTSISKKEGFITLTALFIPKWGYPLAALLLSKDEIG
jgi:hypothetical protein